MKNNKFIKMEQNENSNKYINYITNTKEKSQFSKKLNKKKMPKPLIDTYNYHKQFSKNKLSLKSDCFLLKKHSNSQKSIKKESIQRDINKNNVHTQTPNHSKIINGEFPKRQLTRAMTCFQKCGKEEGLSQIKKKKVKNLELLIKLIDENEKIENEINSNRDYIKINKDNNIIVEKNKSDMNLYVPCTTYNKNNIYFNKHYNLIKKKFNATKTNSNKFIPFLSDKSNNMNIFRCIYDNKKSNNNNIMFNQNFPKENTKYETSISLQKILIDKKNYKHDRKKRKSHTYNLSLSPYLNNNNKYGNLMSPRRDVENNIYNYYNINSSYMNSFNFNTELNNKIYNEKKDKIINNYSNSVKALTNSIIRSKEKINKITFMPLVNEIIKESSKIEKELKNNYKNSKDKEKKEKDKKKKIKEVKKLTKRRKINIDALRQQLNLDKNHFDVNKKNSCFDINDILIKNTNKMKKILPKDGLSSQVSHFSIAPSISSRHR